LVLNSSAFSALLTARHAGIRPVTMIESADRITARRPGDLIARVLLGIPVRTRTRLVRIEGSDRVSGVVVEHEGRQETIACDGCDFSPAASRRKQARCGAAISISIQGPAVRASIANGAAPIRLILLLEICCGRSSIRAWPPVKVRLLRRLFCEPLTVACLRQERDRRSRPAEVCAMCIRSGWCRGGSLCDCLAA